MIRYFETIDLPVDREKREVIVPTWRQDLERMADLAEEVVRFYGYDNIPMTLPSGAATSGGLSQKLQHEDMVREVVENYGFCEGMTFSFESPKVYDKLNLSEDDASQEYSDHESFGRGLQCNAYFRTWWNVNFSGYEL